MMWVRKEVWNWMWNPWSQWTTRNSFPLVAETNTCDAILEHQKSSQKLRLRMVSKIRLSLQNNLVRNEFHDKANKIWQRSSWKHFPCTASRDEAWEAFHWLIPEDPSLWIKSGHKASVVSALWRWQLSPKNGGGQSMKGSLQLAPTPGVCANDRGEVQEAGSDGLQGLQLLPFRASVQQQIQEESSRVPVWRRFHPSLRNLAN